MACRDHLLSEIFSFLRIYHDSSRPLLLGLSGGMDSLALFHLLLDYQRAHRLDLHVAHIDHRWREESSAEASLLQNIVQGAGIPFYLKVLDQEVPACNLEEIGRQERLKFFAEVCTKVRCQAVMLGHHADDRAETVLKHVLEGASLTHGGGLRPVATIEGLVVWRPMLKIRKAEIAQWCHGRDLNAFDDYTNRDDRFLRARLRKTVIPTLSATFGKEVTSGLCAVADESEALKNYLDARLKGVLDSIQESYLGCMLDLSDNLPEHDFERKYIVRAVCRRAGFVLSKDALEYACQSLQRKEANRQVAMGKAVLHLDRGRLIACKDQLGSWQAEVIPARKQMRSISWKDVVTGEFEVLLPEGEYAIGRAEPQDRFRGKRLDRWWQEQRVPAFLRYIVPVIRSGGEIVCEFLSGRGCLNEKSSAGLSVRFFLERTQRHRGSGIGRE